MTKDMDGLGTIFIFVERTFGRNSPIREDQLKPDVQMIYDECPFKDGPPEFCYLLDYVVANAIIETLDLDYELLLEASMAEGAPVCVFRLLDSSDQEDEGGSRSARKPQLPDISKKMLDSFAIQYLGEHWVMITRAIGDYERSAEVLALLAERFRELGHRRAKDLQQALGLDGNDICCIELVIELMNALLIQRGESVIHSRDRIEKKITSCPFQYAPEEIQVQFEAFTNGVIEAINPKYELVHVSGMCRGDSECKRIIRTR